MNWTRVKERFPKTYKELREFSTKTKTDGYVCISNFLESKGYSIGNTWIYQMREYEDSLWIDRNGRIVEIKTLSDKWLNNIRKSTSKNKAILDEIKRRKNKRSKERTSI